MATNLNFTYHVTFSSNKEINIQIGFQDPILVSTTEADIFRVEFYDLSIFNVTQKDTHGLSSFSLTSKIPKQKSQGEATFNVAATEAFLMTALGSAIAFTFVSSFFLNQVLSMVESLTLFLHVCLIGLNYPSNIIKFFEAFFPLVTFDPISTDKLFESIFKFSQVTNDEPFTY